MNPHPYTIEIATKKILDNLIKNGDCLEYKLSNNKDGYGRVKVAGKMCVAHKLVYQHFNGPVQKGCCVCHTCDNPPCCNINHLFTATHQENMKDSVMKNRRYRPMGEVNYNHILTEDDIRNIRSDSRPTVELAKEYKTCGSNIRMIKRCDSWKHII